MFLLRWQEPAPEIAVRRLLAVDLQVDATELDGLDEFGCQRKGAGEGAARGFGDGQVEDHRPADAPRPEMQLCDGGRRLQPFERAADGEAPAAQRGGGRS